MKTPEEIKKGLDMCIRMAYSDECPYFKTGCRMGNMLMRDALPYIKQLEAQVPRWISVEERLPEVGKKVLVFNDGNMFVAKFKRNSLFEDRYGYSHYFDGDTCWMLLPEPPKEGDDEG